MDKLNRVLAIFFIVSYVAFFAASFTFSHNAALYKADAAIALGGYLWCRMDMKR